MAKQIEIREGSVADIPLIVDRAQVFNDLAKDGYGKFMTYDAKSVGENLASVLLRGAKMWVLWSDDEFAGIIMGTIVPNFYNHEQKVANCAFVAVHPDYQRSRWGAKLMGVFEAWAKESGAGHVMYTGYDPKWIRTMKRNGFHQTEVRFMKEL